jgi:hypothetical protein
MAERIGEGEIRINADDRDFRSDLREDQRLFDKFTNNVRKTRATAAVTLEMKKFTSDYAAVKMMMKDLAKQKATATVDMNTRGFKRAAVETRATFLWLANAKKVFDERVGDDKATQKWLRSLGGIRLQMGLFSTTLRQATRALVVMGPIIEAVAGSFVALAGSMGSAALGGATALGAGLAGLVGGLTLVKSAIQPTINGIDQAFKAQAAYNDSVRKFGTDSSKTAKKLKELNSVMAHIPAESRDAVRAAVELRSEWKNLTRETARTQVFATLGEGVKTAQANIGNFASQTNAAMRTVGGAIRGAFRYLRGDEGAGALNTILSGFNSALPHILKGLGQLGALLLRVFAAAQPAFVGLMKSFADWATNLNQANSDSNALGATIDNQVSKFRVWVDLLSATGGLLKAVFGGGSESGTEFAMSITNILNRWTAFLNTAKGRDELRTTFAQAVTMAKQFFTVLGTVISILYAVTTATRPFAAAIVGIATAVGQVTAAFAGTDLGQAVIKAMAAVWLIARANALRYRAAALVSAAADKAVAAAVLAKNAAIKIMNATMLVARGGMAAFTAVARVARATMVASAAAARLLGAAMTIALGPVGLIIAAIAALAAGLVILYKRNEAFRNFVDGAWSAIKGVIVDAAGGIWDFVKGVWHQMERLFKGDLLSSAIQKGFGAAKNIAVGLVNGIIDVINLLPGVNIGKVGDDKTKKVTGTTGASSGGGANRRGPLAQAQGGWHARAAGGNVQGAQEGGLVTAPMVIMGEEAPKHPEWVIPENPAYRKRAIALWEMAGRNIGAYASGGKAFAQGGRNDRTGGLPGDLKKLAGSAFDALAGGGKALLGKLPGNPFKDPFTGMGSFMLKAGGKYIKDKVQEALSFIGVGGKGQKLGKGSPGSLRGAAALAREMGLSITSTTGGSHTPGSYHYKGRAIDVSNGSGPTPQMAAYYRAIKRRYGSNITELFYDPLGGIKHGQEIGAIGGHSDHVHVAFRKGGQRGPGGAMMFRKGGQNTGGGSNARAIAAYLKAKGFSNAQIAGILGNLKQESGFRPNAVERPGDPMSGHGIAQWTGGRANALRAYAKSKGRNWDDLGVQLDFMMHEFQTSERGAYSAVKGAKSVEQAESAFGLKFERYGIMGNRSGRQYLKMVQSIKGGGEDWTDPGSTTGGGGAAEGPTAAEVARREKALQKRIDRIADEITGLLNKKSDLPGGKKGKSRRDEIDKKVRALRAQKTKLQRQKRDLPDPVDPENIARTGPSTTFDIKKESLDAMEALAAETPSFDDDFRATEKWFALMGDQYIEDNERLQKVNAALSPKRKLTDKKRDELLQEKQAILGRNREYRAGFNERNVKREEMGIERRFGGGYGRAGIDLMTAQAESTADLGDDIAVMNQSLAMWQQLLAARTKRKDIAGMTEAQNAINQLNQNIKQANEQIAQQDISAGVDAAQTAVNLAQTTRGLADDINALYNQRNILYGAMLKANYYGFMQQRDELYAQVRALDEPIRDLQWQLQEQPLTARRALAALTENTEDDRAVLKDILGLHEARLAYWQSIGDYAGIAEEAGIVKQLRDELNQEETNRIEMIRSISEQRQNLYRTMGSNQVSGGLTPVGTNVIVNNYYKTMPMDAHTWSRDLSFEIRAAT